MLINLADPAARDIALAGGKGSALARLIQDGLSVPPGLVITTRAFDEFIKLAGIGAHIKRLSELNAGAGMDDINAIIGPVREAIISSSLPGRLLLDLMKSLDELGPDAAWAVRSSAVAEDRETASFAGQYDTILGVRGPVDMAGAVLSCWASFFNAHAVAYKLERGIADFKAAVIVQKLVPADAAGVCFTMDPVTGDPDRVLINANFGLGESVVSGRVTPDTFVIAKTGARILEKSIARKLIKIIPATRGAVEALLDDDQSNQPSITDDQAQRIAELAIIIEQRENRPVDVEWAVRDNQVFILQSRPITTIVPAGAPAEPGPPDNWAPQLNTPIDPRYPLYSNGNISEVLPGCITPLSWSYIAPTIEGAFRNQGIELGSMSAEGPEYQVLGFFYHRPYICVSFMKAAAKRLPGMSPDTIHEEFVGPVEHPTPPVTPRDLLPDRWPAIYRIATTFFKKQASVGRDALACEKLVRTQRRESTPEKLKQWSDDQLIEAVQFTKPMSKLSDVHIWASSFAVVYFDMLRKLTAKWLDQNDAAAAKMVTGIGGLPSADPAFGLYRLAARANSTEQIKRSFESISDNQALLDKLGSEEGSRDFVVEFEAFLEQYGHRAVCEAEFKNPGWREDPAQVIGLIRNFMAPAITSPEESRRRQDRIRNEAAETIQKLSWPKRVALNKVLAAARKNIELREKLKDLIVLRSDRARRVYTEIKQRLASKSLLADPDDIYFLVWSEVRDLARGKMDAGQSRQIIQKRRLEYRWSESVSLPKIIEGQARPLPDRDFPPESLLKGMGVSPGLVEGPARVILDPRRESQILPGEILVAPVTDAGWTPLFIAAAGLVVDVGGLLSHGSVVAREYGLPAVVGVTGATRRIKSGDRIRINGTTGAVTILD